MKKLFAILLCAMMLTACKEGDVTQMEQSSEQSLTPTQTTTQTTTPAVKTMIVSSEVEPIDDEWTVLGETTVEIDGKSAEVILATSATRESDGYMSWDDSQLWRLIVTSEDNSYSLFDGRLYGAAYVDVSMTGEKYDKPSIRLLNSSAVGLTVTEYVYSDGTFYKENVLLPDGATNNPTYNSFPEYH